MSKREYDFRDPIIQKVVEKFISRSDVGYSKYKVTLDQDSKSINEWLNNIQEELMDAVNYIEKLKAVLATESAKKVLAENLKQKAFKEKSIIDDAEKLAAKISKLDLKISAKVGPDGKLFGSISNADVAKGLVGKKIEVEKENISIPGKSIKRIGKYQASIRLHREVSTQLNFELLAEKK